MEELENGDRVQSWYRDIDRAFAIRALNHCLGSSSSVYKRPTEEFFSHEETVNEQGGKQSKTIYRLDLVDPYAILSLGRVLGKGVKYGKDNWRLIDAESHVNHALGHIMGWLSGDKNDDHLANAFCRLMMAIAMEKPDAQGLR